MLPDEKSTMISVVRHVVADQRIRVVHSIRPTWWISSNSDRTANRIELVLMNGAELWHNVTYGWCTPSVRGKNPRDTKNRALSHEIFAEQH
jgi:hypothetical protein